MRTTRMHVVATSLVLAVVLACGGADDRGGEAVRRTSSGDNQPPVLGAVRVTPNPARAGQLVRVEAEADDPDGDPIRFDYQWWIGGAPRSGATQPTFDTRGLARGSELVVRVAASDHALRSKEAIVPVVLENQPPKVRNVAIAPGGDVRPGDTLEAVVDAEDPDGDRMRFTYEWFVNGKSVATTATLDTSRFRRGDRVEVAVTGHDGTESGHPQRSASRELANRPPVIAGVPKPVQKGDVFEYQFEASDPDGDRRLRYELIEGPEGMVMDALLGRISWRPDREDVGRHPVELRVSDGRGDSTVLRFDVTVDAVAEPGAAPASPDGN